MFLCIVDKCQRVFQKSPEGAHYAMSLTNKEGKALFLPLRNMGDTTG